MAVLDLLHGDCRTVMAGLPAASVDAVVCDPPYGLSFMGKDWDHGVPGVAFWSAALRVAKPGAHLLAFGGTRTFHRLAVAIEDAGWEIRDTVMWVYGSGFPKSHSVSKGIDRAAGAERPRTVPNTQGKPINAWKVEHGGQANHWQAEAYKRGEKFMLKSNEPITDAARQWDGWGTALKPAWEPIIVARKPLEGTVAANVLAHGTGGLNIDGCRVGTEVIHSNGEGAGGLQMGAKRHGARPYVKGLAHKATPSDHLGRWPANLIHDGSDEVLAGFPQSKAPAPYKRSAKRADALFDGGIKEDGDAANNYADTGSAARFFYCAKASKADRDEGCEGMEVRQTTGGGGMNDPNGDDVCGKYGSVKSPSRNHHPTVKPTALMRYLCKLVTPPAGTVLDPFMGSGSTGKAAVLEGFGFIGIEQDADYIAIARARIAHAVQSPAQQPLHI